MTKNSPTNAYVLSGSPDEDGAFVFLCEHATHIVPPPLQPSASDWLWLQQHWGWDLGIEDVTQTLLNAMGGCGIFSRFSRLICDPNRDHEAESWLVREIEGISLDINTDVDDAERARRKTLYHDAYHNAVDELITARQQAEGAGPFTLLAMHSFTPVYQKEIRTMEIGVLYDEVWSTPAGWLAEELSREGFVVAHNAPYSGMDGLIYSAWRHGSAHQVRYLELEIRQDLIGTPETARHIAMRMEPALQRFAARCQSERD